MVELNLLRKKVSIIRQEHDNVRVSYGHVERGFSLVELSIVILIIGILIAGVLKGTELIKTSKLQSLSREIGELKASFITFKDKYSSIPGDMTGAKSFKWCGATNDVANPCNGNGNGVLDTGDGSSTSEYTDGSSSEGAKMWIHLENAGLFKGRKSLSTPSSNEQRRNCRVSNAFSDISFVASPANITHSGWDPYTKNNRHYIIAGDCSEHDSLSGVLTPSQVAFIDDKIDNGDGDSGEILGVGKSTDSIGCSNQNGSGSGPSDYVSSKDAAVCSIFINITKW